MISEKYDLILAGTGFASSFFLKKFLEHSSKETRVLVIERGGFFSHSSRLKVKRGDTTLPTEFRFRDRDTYTSKSDKPWAIEPNFGGNSNCWVGCTPRFMPNDFRIESEYGVGMDWPIQYSDIEDYYYETEEIMSISGPDVTPFPKSKPYPLPSHILSSVDRVMQNHYGPLYISQPTARASRATGKRAACCASSVCTLCPVDSKFTIENSMKYVYEDPRVTLIHHAQVLSLRIENNIARSALVRHDEKDVEYFGETIALGTNAIFNAHILLNSGDTLHWTGKGISDQIGTFVRMYLNDLDNVGGSNLITANGYMFYDTPDRKNRAGCFIESIASPIIRNERGKWRKIAWFKFIFEDLPSEKNYVTTSPDITKPEIVFNGVSDYAQRGFETLESNINKYFSVLPIERIEYDGYNQETEYHICGTTRMSTSKENGVIDRDLVHHQYRNVLVLGSGSFPTITPANPTLTLSALSLRAAEKYLNV